MDIYKLLVYVLASSFQIAGAIILIMKYWGNTKQRVINEYYPGTGIASNDGDNNAVLEVTHVRDCVIEIYANRVAFINIAIGYTMSIFGEKGTVKNIYIFLSVIGFSGLLIGIEKMVAKLIARIRYKEDIVVPYDELPTHIDRTISNKDLEELIHRFE